MIKGFEKELKQWKDNKIDVNMIDSINRELRQQTAKNVQFAEKNIVGIVFGNE